MALGGGWNSSTKLSQVSMRAIPETFCHSKSQQMQQQQHDNYGYPMNEPPWWEKMHANSGEMSRRARTAQRKRPATVPTATFEPVFGEDDIPQCCFCGADLTAAELVLDRPPRCELILRQPDSVKCCQKCFCKNSRQCATSTGFKSGVPRMRSAPGGVTAAPDVVYDTDDCYRQVITRCRRQPVAHICTPVGPEVKREAIYFWKENAYLDGEERLERVYGGSRVASRQRPQTCDSTFLSRSGRLGDTSPNYVKYKCPYPNVPRNTTTTHLRPHTSSTRGGTTTAPAAVVGAAASSAAAAAAAGGGAHTLTENVLDALTQSQSHESDAHAVPSLASLGSKKPHLPRNSSHVLAVLDDHAAASGATATTTTTTTTTSTNALLPPPSVPSNNTTTNTAASTRPATAAAKLHSSAPFPPLYSPKSRLPPPRPSPCTMRFSRPQKCPIHNVDAELICTIVPSDLTLLSENLSRWPDDLRGPPTRPATTRQRRIREAVEMM